MKNFKPILLLFIVLACEEPPTDTQPSPDENNIKLSRVEQTMMSTGETLVTAFIYENDLLVSATTDEVQTSYFYNDDLLVSTVMEDNDGWTTKSTYTYEEGKLIKRVETTGPSDSYSLFEYEYINVTESQMRINAFRVDGMERNLQGYNICSITDGNIMSEVSYDAMGNLEEYSVENEFGAALNPFNLWRGHPQIASKNLAIMTETFFQNESSSLHLENIQLNEDNLPIKFSSKRDSTDNAVSTTVLFYQN